MTEDRPDLKSLLPPTRVGRVILFVSLAGLLFIWFISLNLFGGPRRATLFGPSPSSGPGWHAEWLTWFWFDWFNDPRGAAIFVPQAIVLLLLSAYPAWWLARTARRILWHRRGGCPICGYDLRGNVSGICPECGTPLGSHNP